MHEPIATPIRDYGLIGNRHSCALVSRAGSIDWCCLPHLESASIFAAVLDPNRGGAWTITPDAVQEVRRRYVGVSAVLETRFRSATGAMRLRDFMPIRGGRGSEASRSAHTIVRMARCTAGRVEFDLNWQPRPNYARDDVLVTLDDDSFRADARSGEMWLCGLPRDATRELSGAAVRARITLEEGEEVALITGWGEQPNGDAAALAERYLDETLDWWAEWAEGCVIDPAAAPWTAQVLRSGMVLQLLTNERTGAMAAAPTTSLPEEIGGVRNWDYRFCWVRDSSMIARAFLTIGHRRDSIAFLRFLETAARQGRDPARVQVLYGLNGERRLPEYTLGHLDGYAGSRPVRIGNDAALQRQLDVFGELLESAHALLEMGAEPTPEQREWLRALADHVCDIWRFPDAGIWEVRGPERHFTYSKLMCWVALDRAIRIAGLLGSEVDTTRWLRERDEIRVAIETRGFDAERGTFTQSFDDDALDAATLLIPRYGFLPASDPRVQGTIDAILNELTANGLVARYDTRRTHDGVSGGEGAFVICTFWMVDALSLSGRVAEATEMFEHLLGLANDLGLYSEEIDPVSGMFLGNFPQAFSHVGLINSANLLGRAMAERERREQDVHSGRSSREATRRIAGSGS